MKPLPDAWGIAVSACDPGSLALLESALASLQSGSGDALARIRALLERDPRCAAGHCLQLAALVLASEVPGEPALGDAIRAFERFGGHASDRELRHCAAARAVLAGDARLALERYGDLVVDYPRDVLALKLAHALDFRLGQREMLRDRIAQCLPHWNDSVPGFGGVLAMYAFGLEENGDYVRAEAAARRALELEPCNAAAIHVVAHVNEMQGRARDGIAWLEATRHAWRRHAGFAVHNAWHLALFHIDLNASDAAMAIYDDLLAPGPTSSTAALADASALLWRLGLRGIDLAGRWSTLAQCWRRKPLQGQRTFYLIHALMAFTAARETALARRVTGLLRAQTAARPAGVTDEFALAIPLSEALQAFAGADYEAAVERMSTVRAMAHRCGGSLAQCDLIHLTLIEAALRGERARLAQALAAERAALRPGSLLNRLLFARAGAVAGAR